MMLEVLVTELIKLRRSKLPWLSWLAFSLLPLVGGSFMWIAENPERARSLGLLGQKAQLAGLSASAQSYFGLLLQATGMAGMVLVSILTAYVFGREHSDGTAKNLLCLPLPRSYFVVAKLALVLGWFAVLTLGLLLEGYAVAALLGLPGLSASLLLHAGAEILLAALVAWLLTPCVAFIACSGRGYLAPLGFTFAMLLLGNVLGATGWGKWFPWSIVPLYAGVAAHAAKHWRRRACCSWRLPAGWGR